MALKYRVKFGEEQQFLEQDEVNQLNRFIGGAIDALGREATQDQKILAAREAQKKWLAEHLPAELVPVRITKNLLWTAVNLRYTVGQGQVQIPRKAEGKQRPGIWWGEIQDHLETLVEDGVLTTVLPLDPAIANWLVLTVWQDDKVQNGFPPQLQMWMNVLDAEMERLADELGGSRKK
jgi:hypothetical protein